MPGVTDDELLVVAERVRSAVGKLPIQARGQAINQTVSIGVSGASGMHPMKLEVLVAADKAHASGEETRQESRRMDFGCL